MIDISNSLNVMIKNNISPIYAFAILGGNNYESIHEQSLSNAESIHDTATESKRHNMGARYRRS